MQEFEALTTNLLTILLTVFAWRHIFDFKEASIEVGEVIKAGIVTDFSYTVITFNKSSTGMANSDFIDILNKILTGIFFEETRKGF